MHWYFNHCQDQLQALWSGDILGKWGHLLFGSHNLKRLFVGSDLVLGFRSVGFDDSPDTYMLHALTVCAPQVGTQRGQVKRHTGLMLFSCICHCKEIEIGIIKEGI